MGTTAPSSAGWTSGTGAAKAIGRVGALAVALGIGTAVATTPWVACAEPSGSDSSSSSESSNSSDSSSAAESTAESAAESAAVESSAVGSVASSPESVATEPEPDVVVDSSGDADTLPAGGVPLDEAEEIREPADPELAESAPTEPEETDASASTTEVTTPLPPTTEVPSATDTAGDGDHVAVTHPPARPVVSEPHQAGRGAVTAPSSSNDPVRLTATAEVDRPDINEAIAARPAPPAVESTNVAAQAVPAATAATVTAADAVFGLVGFAPIAGTTPATPLHPVGLWAVLAWVRREIESTFCNQTPTIGYNAAENSQAVDGVVSGDLNAVDADGDTLSFTVAEGPENGSVVVNPDGTFTYTPEPGFARTGGTDEFTVKVSDAGPHLHGPSGLLNAISFGLLGDPGHSATETVAVTVAPIANTVIATIDVGGDPFDVAVSPDGATAYVANSDGTVSVLDTATNTVTHTIPVGNLPTAVAVGPDGAHAYTANTFDGTVSVIDTATNTVTATITVGGDPSAVAVSPDGTTAYTVDPGADTMSVIDTATNTVTATITVGIDPVAVVVSPDSAHAYTANRFDDTVSVIDTVTNTVTATIGVGVDPFAVAVSADGTSAYVTNRLDDTVSVIDTATNTVTATITVGDGPFDVAVSADGATAYVTNSRDDTVSVIDTATNTVTHTIPVGDNPLAVAVSPDGTTAYVTNRLDDTVSVIALAPASSSSMAAMSTMAALTRTAPTGAVADIVSSLLTWVQHTFFNQTPTIGYNPAENSQAIDGVVTGYLNAVDADGDPLTYTVTDGPNSGAVVVNPDGTFTYTPEPGFARTGGSDEFIVKVSDAGRHLHGLSGLLNAISFGLLGDPGHSATETVAVTVAPIANTIIATIDVGDWPYNLDMHPDGASVYVSNGDDGTVSVIDTNSNTVTDTISVGRYTSEVVISPDGTTAYVNVNDGSRYAVAVIDTATNTVSTTISIGTGPHGLTVSPDGATVYVTNSNDDTISVIDTTTNTVTHTIAVGRFPATVGLSPDGATAYVSTYEDNTISVIDTTTNAVTHTIAVGGTPYGVALSSDGATVYISHGIQGIVSVIDAATNTVTASIPVGSPGTSVIESLAFSPDGGTLYVSDRYNHTVSLIDTATNTVTDTIVLDTTSIGDIAVSPDGTTLYAAHFGSDTVSVIALAPTSSSSMADMSTMAALTPTAPTGAFDPVSSLLTWIQHTFFNQSPTIGYDSTGNSQSMHMVSGDLNAVDPEGDPLSYRVAENPQHGSVTINPDGTFTYTPNTDMALTGGTDEFTVKIRDTGAHLHGLFGFLTPDQGHSTTETIAVTVAANQPPLVGDQPVTIDHIDQKTGVITGSVHVTDPDGDTLTYRLNTDPVYGNVTVDAKTGQWTYTPTQAARLLAGLPTPPTTDTTGLIAFGDEPGPVPFDWFDIDVIEVGLNDGPFVVVDIPIQTDWIIPAGFRLVESVAVGVGAARVAVNPILDRVYVTNASSHTVSVIDTTTNTNIATIPVGANPDDVAVSPDGATAYVGSTGVHVSTDKLDTVSVIDTATNTVTATIPVGISPIRVVVHPDGDSLYVSLSDTVRVVGTGTGHPTIDTIPVDHPFSMAFIPGRQRLYVVNSSDNTLSLINTSFGNVVGTPIPVGYGPFEVAVSPDGGRAYVASYRSVSVIDPVGNTVIDTIDVDDSSQLRGVAVSPDSSLVYVGLRGTGDAPPQVLVIDTVSNRVITTLAGWYDLHNFVNDVAVSTDGTRIYVTNQMQDSSPDHVSVIEFTPA